MVKMERVGPSFPTQAKPISKRRDNNPTKECYHD
jgi:hypothetical protein